MPKRALILGGGFAGCASAHLLARKGDWNVTLVERAPVLGGGNKTLWWGGHPHTFGPRHFLTQDEEVYTYLNEIVPLRSCNDHIFLSYIEEDQSFFNYPIHLDDVPKMTDSIKIQGELKHVEKTFRVAPNNFEEYWIRSIGPTLYRKFVDTYSKKMWKVEDNAAIDDFSWSPKGVALKDGPRQAWDRAMSAYPKGIEGYDPYFDVATKNATVRLNTAIDAFDVPHLRFQIDGEWQQYDLFINTISPDLLFGQCYGALPYIGRDLHRIVLPVEFAFPENVYFLYYPNSEIFTRLVEYKKFTGYSSPQTLLGMEVPSLNGRYYPIPIKTEYDRAEKYFKLMPDKAFSIGRAGSYQYRVDIDDCIRQAMDIVKAL